MIGAGSPAPSEPAPADPSARPRPSEWAWAALLGAATLALLAPWPAPSVDLRRACALREAGWHGAACDLEAAARKADAPWLQGPIRVYEDGLLLSRVPHAAEPQSQTRGAYHTDGAVLTVSALERGHPLSNGRAYEARPQRWDPAGLAGLRPWSAALLMAVVAVAGLARRRLALAWTMAAAIAAACLALQLWSAPWFMVHVDAGDTLGAAEAISRGAVPYRTLYYSPYTPLGAYAFSFWGRLWPGAGPPPYDWYVGLVVLCQAGVAAFVLALLARAGAGRALAGVTALCLLSMMLWFDGLRVLHEPLYLLPILASAWLALRAEGWRAGLAGGALNAGAFLIKQYGGFGLAGLLGHALTAGPPRLPRTAWIVAGFVLGLAALAGLLVVAGTDPLGFARGLVPDAGRTYQLVWLELFLWRCPIVLPALVAPLLPGAWSRPTLRLAAWFGLASCLPLLFRQHQYYFINLCPWLFLLFALGLDHVPRIPRRITLTAGLALLVSMPLRAAQDAAAAVEVDWRADQVRRARVMTLLWPAKEPTLFLVHPGLQHLTRYRSPDEAEVGYRYIPDLDAARLRAAFRAARGAWIDRSMFANRPAGTLQAAGSSLQEELARNGFERRLVLESRFHLWTKEPVSRRQLLSAGGVRLAGEGEAPP